MVKKLLLLSLLTGTIISAGALADTHMTVKADKKIMALGEPLVVMLQVDDVRVALSNIKLDKLKKNFDVFGVSSSTQTRMIRGRKVAAETMTLTLYPLRTGKLQLPAFSYMGKNSKVLEVSVLESNQQTPRVIFKTALDVTQAQVRQAATLTLDIYDDGSLQWSAPHELMISGAHQRRLADSQREEMIEGHRYTVHRYAWALMPLREGRQAVEFAMLDAFKFGARLRYPLAPFWIDAAPVPAYLPVQVPIGKPVITLEALPEKIALERPLNWKFTVQGNGISAEGLSKLLSTMHSNDAMQFYPLTISNADTARATTATQLLQVTLPFVPLKTGMQKLPEINLPYYDPQTGRVESVLIPGVALKVINPLWFTVAKIIVGGIVSGAVIVSGCWIVALFSGMRRKRSAILAIRNAASGDELKRAVLNFDHDASTSSYANITLQQWLLQKQRRYGRDELLDVIVHKLESAQYGIADADAGINQLAFDIAKRLNLIPLIAYGSQMNNCNTMIILNKLLIRFDWKSSAALH